MKTLLLLLLAAGGAGSVLGACEIHVAPNGNDANPGTAAQPLATPMGARAAVRALRMRNGGKLPDGGVQIVVADGVYHLAQPLTLGKEDGGTPDAPVVWRAANRAKAVFSGDLKPAGWKLVDDPLARELLGDEAKRHVLQADIPGDVELPGFRGGGCGTPGHLQEIPLSLFENGERLELARWPDTGFARTGANVGKPETRHDAAFCTSGVFRFASDRLDAWAKEPDLWTYGLWCYEWADAKAKVLKVDAAAGTIAVDPSPIGFGIRERAQFQILNALSELNRPGEWVLDRARRRVYVWPKTPRGDYRLASAPGLVVAKDVSNIVFDGLVFEYARTDALVFRNARRVSVRSAIVRHTSAAGVVMDGGASNRVEGCDLYDLGEGGIRLSAGDFNTLTPAGHVADNNHIHHYGQVVPNYRPGVALDGVGNRCTHNLIHHSIHQAISFGGNDHYIGFNVLHDLCMFNDDAGSIYCCQRDWTKRGTVIEHNLIHMTGKQPRATHTEAVYLDDYSSGIIVRGNLINRASLGVHIGGGQDCVVERNVFMNCGHGADIGSRGIDSFARGIALKGRESGMFKRLDSVRSLLEGSLWRARYPKLLKVYEFEDAQFAHNALFNVITNNVLAGCGGLSMGNAKKIAPYTTMTNNLELAADPGFDDYFNFGWNLRKESAAYKLVGDLRFAEMGLYESPLRVSPAVKFGTPVTKPRPIRVEYALPTVRIDFPLMGDLPTNVTEMATACQGCTVPNWSRGKRVMAAFGSASLEEWLPYSCTFTPLCDGVAVLETMGARGEKTLYDDFRVTGADFVNGGFEEDRGWGVPCPSPTDYRAPICNLAKPWGVLTAQEAGVPAAEGNRMACGCDMLNFHQRLVLKKGVPVTVTFKARALPIRE